MWYGKNDDDDDRAPALIRHYSDDEVRLTARYCNKNDDGYNIPCPKESPKANTMSINLKNAKVGEYVEGLEKLGKIVKITNSKAVMPGREKGNCTGVIKENFIKWLTAYNFKFEHSSYNYDSYYLNKHGITFTVFISREGLIIIESDSPDFTATTTKQAGMYIKEII